MTDLWVEPRITHRLAIALRFVDLFTRRPVSDRLRVRLRGWEPWEPVYGVGDHTYRFTSSNEPVPAIGLVDVIVESTEHAARYVNAVPLQVDVPRPLPVPSPITVGHFLVEHPLEPTRAFRTPPGETAVRGVLRQGGVPQSGFAVAIAVGAAPGPATPAVHTDVDGEFLYRLPAATATVVAPNITSTVDLFVAVSDAAGVAQPVLAPPLPHTIDIGRPMSLPIDI